MWTACRSPSSADFKRIYFVSVPAFGDKKNNDAFGRSVFKCVTLNRVVLITAEESPSRNEFYSRPGKAWRFFLGTQAEIPIF